MSRVRWCIFHFGTISYSLSAITVICRPITKLCRQGFINQLYGSCRLNPNHTIFNEHVSMRMWNVTKRATTLHVDECFILHSKLSIRDFRSLILLKNRSAPSLVIGEVRKMGYRRLENMSLTIMMFQTFFILISSTVKFSLFFWN